MKALIGSQNQSDRSVGDRKAHSVVVTDTRELIYANCYSIDKFTDEISWYSSPFVAASAGLMILSCPIQRKATSERLTELAEILRSKSKDGLSSFTLDRQYGFDIDSTALVSLFLYRMGYTNSVDKAVDRLLEAGRSKKSGGLRTWLYRDRNPVDYMVNLNVYCLFNARGHKDLKLEKYLNSNADSFLENGSRYYRDLNFPLLLLRSYRDNHIISGSNLFIAILLARIQSKLISTVGYDDRKDSTSTSLVSSPEAQLPFQYFNSSSKSFHSSLLDHIITSMNKSDSASSKGFDLSTLVSPPTVSSPTGIAQYSSSSAQLSDECR